MGIGIYLGTSFICNANFIHYPSIIHNHYLNQIYYI